MRKGVISQLETGFQPELQHVYPCRIEDAVDVELFLVDKADGRNALLDDRFQEIFVDRLNSLLWCGVCALGREIVEGDGHPASHFRLIGGQIPQADHQACA